MNIDLCPNLVIILQSNQEENLIKDLKNFLRCCGHIFSNNIPILTL